MTQTDRRQGCSVGNRADVSVQMLEKAEMTLASAIVIPSPGTKASEGSETVPRIAPQGVWAEAVTAATNAITVQLADRNPRTAYTGRLRACLSVKTTCLFTDL